MMSKSTAPDFDRMLQAGEVVLREIDPLQLRSRVGLPRLQEATKHEVVQVLECDSHEGELDALELTRLHVGFGRPEAELADLLPVSVGRGSVAGARDLHDLGDDAVGGVGRARCERQGAARRQRCGGAPGAFQQLAPAGLHRHQPFVDVNAHEVTLPAFGHCCRFAFPRVSASGGAWPRRTVGRLRSIRRQVQEE